MMLSGTGFFQFFYASRHRSYRKKISMYENIVCNCSKESLWRPMQTQGTIDNSFNANCLFSKKIRLREYMSHSAAQLY